jgi:deoxyribose-phosphate aldolase
MDKATLAKYLDLANHHQEATLEKIKSLCAQVLEYGFNGAFVNPVFVADVKAFLLGRAKVGTVISFPLGQETQEIKLAAVAKAIEDGADELDVSLNVGYLKSGLYEESSEEMQKIVQAAKTQKETVLVKLIIEAGCLTDEEIKKASELVLGSGADFIKTSSGFGPRGASLRDVDLIKEAVGEKIKIKVAGGIDTLDEAMAFIDKGVARIGTSGAIKIIQELETLSLE